MQPRNSPRTADRYPTVLPQEIIVDGKHVITRPQANIRLLATSSSALLEQWDQVARQVMDNAEQKLLHLSARLGLAACN